MGTTSIPKTGAKPKAGAQPGKPGFFDEMGELVIFTGQVFRRLPGSLRYYSEIMRVNGIITRRTTLLLFVMCAFLGLSASNFGFFFLRSIGASDFAGVVPGVLTPRQTAPQMFGYVFAGTVCCGYAAELASARIQQEIDAYLSEGIDPMEILVGPRILAAMLWVPLAAGVALCGQLAGSYLVIVLILKGNNGSQLLDTFFSVLPLKSLLYCTVTIALMTLQCSIVACFYGMRNTGGGPAAVGGAIARSLGINLILLHFVFSLAGLIFYSGSVGLPIGD